jgi:hypothetical protein
MGGGGIWMKNGKGEKTFSRPNTDMRVKQNDKVILQMSGLVLMFTRIFTNFNVYNIGDKQKGRTKIN